MSEPRKISCILIDDDYKAISQFERAIKECSQFNLLASYQNAEDYKRAAVKFSPDILFTDVEMPEKDGITLAKEIQKLKLPSKLVFVTGHSKYAFDAIRIHPFSYLTKPVIPEDLKELAIMFMTNGQRNEPESNVKLRFNTANGFLLLDESKIMSVEADGNYSLTTMDNGQSHMITCTLKKMLGQLQNKNIVRVSRSLMLNLDYISFVDRKKNTCQLDSDRHSFEIVVQRVGIRNLSAHLGREA